MDNAREVTAAAAALAEVVAAEQVLLEEAHLCDDLYTLVLLALSGPDSVLAGSAEPRWARLPLLACASASAGPSTAAVSLAVAVELQTAAYGLFDALEDGDSSAVTRRVGPRVACNVATTLLALAQSALLHVPALAGTCMAAAWIRTCGGQHRDLSLDLDGPPPLAVALQAAEGKTAASTAAALEAGAIVGGADAALAARYRRFGRAVGLAGQFANDLLGLRPGPDGATDVSRGQLTVPISFALGGDVPALRACLAAARAGESVDSTMHARALEELVVAGGHRYAWLSLESARRDIAEALAEIARYRPVHGTLDRLLPVTPTRMWLSP